MFMIVYAVLSHTYWSTEGTLIGTFMPVRIISQQYRCDNDSVLSIYIYFLSLLASNKVTLYLKTSTYVPSVYSK